MRTFFFLCSVLSFANTEITIEGVKLSTPLECNRECKKNSAPKTCYYQFTIEDYTVLSRACQGCTPKADNQFTSECQCVITDGVERTYLSVNRQYPGPSIQVCQNDTVVVDVRNQVEGSSMTIHWHGVWQTGTPYYDGVPHVTQCPIIDGTTFRYKWKAGNEGTHFWHSHSGLQKIDGLCGSLIIRVPKSLDPLKHLYDFDLWEHVILINDWMHERADEKYPGRLVNLVGQNADSFLINGKGQTINPWDGCRTNTSLAQFTVTPRSRYRFRVINAVASVCPVQLTIENHNMTIIASDGVGVAPVVVSSFISYSGERYDFVIETNQATGTFWIQIKGLGLCTLNQVYQLAVLRYTNSSLSRPMTPEPSYNADISTGVTLSPNNFTQCLDNSKSGICVNQLKSVEELGSNINQKPDLQIYAPFLFATYTTENFFQKGYYGTALYVEDGGITTSLINGINYIPDPGNLLSEPKQIDPSILCNATSKSKSCDSTPICSCLPLYKAQINELVEIILLDVKAIPVLIHPFHLHGGVFQLVGMGVAPAGSTMSEQLFNQMENNGSVKRNFDRPPSKDSVYVPSNGYVILRFRATNPGFWFFHCHYLYHTLVGMNMVIQIGEPHEMPKIPKGFPTCGNFQPQI